MKGCHENWWWMLGIIVGFYTHPLLQWFGL